MAIEEHTDPALSEVLQTLDLSPIPTLDPKHRSTRWQMPGGGTVVEFLTPRMTERQDIVKLDTLGVWAQGLPFLNFLLADPVPAVALYREGVLIQIPRPERYAIHKLIVAQRRKPPQEGKARKDLAQAAALITELAEQRPYELLTAYETATAMGPAWADAIARSLKQAPEAAVILNRLGD